MSEGEVGAVVLATEDTGFTGLSELGGESAPLVEVGGRTLFSRVIEAAVEAETVGSVALVGGDSSDGVDEHIDDAGSPEANIRAGLAALDGCVLALVLPGNIPFIREAEIDALVKAAVANGCQVAYPLVTRRSCEAAFPELKRTYFRLAEGELTNGNALFVSVPAFVDHPGVIDEAIALKREPWKLAMMVNPLVLLSYKSGRLSVRDIAGAAEKALGLRAAAIPIDAPGLATDIRKPYDLRVARKMLE